MKLQGRTAVVTGAASGIGRATAKALADRGVRVFASDIDEQGISNLEEHARIQCTACDVADPASVQALCQLAESEAGGIDIWHNNAGIGEGNQDWPDVSVERAGAIVDVNLRGVVQGTRLALGPIERSGGGAIEIQIVQPEDGADLSRDADVDDGSTTLLSPVLDLTGTTEPRIAFWLWYVNSVSIYSSQPDDVFVIDISDDGGTSWTNVQVVAPQVKAAAGAWVRYEFRVADFVQEFHGLIAGGKDRPDPELRVQRLDDHLGADLAQCIAGVFQVFFKDRQRV